MTDLRIVSEPRGDAEDATFVRDGLALFNVAVTGDSYYSPLAIFLKDERGSALGGALGHVWGGSRQRRWSRSRNPGARSSLEAIRRFGSVTGSSRGWRRLQLCHNLTLTRESGTAQGT